MADTFFSDRATLAGKYSLDGLARRQEIIGRNLANVDTPGYLAEDINFESAMQLALNNEDRLRMDVTNTAHLAAPAEQLGTMYRFRRGGYRRADGSDVDIDVELNAQAEAGLRYQAITQLVSRKFLVLKNVAQSR